MDVVVKFLLGSFVKIHKLYGLWSSMDLSIQVVCNQGWSSMDLGIQVVCNPGWSSMDLCIQVVCNPGWSSMDLCIQVVCNPGVPGKTWSPHRAAFYHYCMIMVYPYRTVALVFFLNKCM